MDRTLPRFRNTILLFDMDGTLIDASDPILESFIRAFRIQKLPPPEPAMVLSHVGLPLSVMYEQCGAPSEMLEEMVLLYKDHFRMIGRERTKLIPRVREALDIANGFARMGIVTTKTASHTRLLLEHLGVEGNFETVVGYEDVTHPKPHPEPVLLALDRLGFSGHSLEANRNSAWLIGDTMLDVDAAHAAGIRCAAVRSGYGDLSHLKESERLMIVDDVFEAVEGIRTILSQGGG